MFHIQCLLRKNSRLQTAWIPEKYARVGKFLTLKESPGWEVIKKYSKMKSTEVKERSQDFKHQRKASDI